MAAVAGATLWLLLLTILGFTSTFLAFNVDTKVPIVKEGTRGSYFGFSVAQHQIDNANGGQASYVVVVGAPKDNVTAPGVSEEVRRVVRPGQVYSCPITSFSDDCQPLQLTTELRDNENLTDQWLGVSVASQATTGGLAVACAHRFKYVDPGISVIGLGLCYTMTNKLDFNEFSEPCYGQPKNGEQEFGNCLAGASVAVSKGGDILVGTPRAWAGRGGVFKDRIQKELGDQGQWKMNNIEASNRPDFPKPTCSIDSYLGLATKIGNILPGNEPTYVGGAPRSRENGEVILFQDLSTNPYLSTDERRRLRGDQFGSGYGYNVEVIDINGDGEDDLVVGAPFYHGARIGGAFYVYMNAGGRQTISRDTKPTIFLSREMSRAECEALNCENAQFGISLANLGDIDRDGFQDLAVGAPYEGSGCVYIYRGHLGGLLPEYSQRICGSDLLLARPLTTFGYSLVGGSDVDSSGLPDIAVGAFESSKLVILRSRPVIRIEPLMQPVPERIQPDVNRCPTDGELFNCFQIRSCFRYSVEPKDRSFRGLEINYKLEAETFTGKTFSRAFFKSKQHEPDKHIVEGVIQLDRPNMDHKCAVNIVYLSRTNSDFLNPIQFQLTYSLSDNRIPTMTRGGPLPDINQYPVINQAEAKEILVADFVKNCGPDEKCHSNLDLRAEFTNLKKDEEGNSILKVGQFDELGLLISVVNLGEDAHETILTVLLPEGKGISFIQTSPRNIGCKPNEEGHEITCSKIGNPLQKDSSNNFVMRLDPKNMSPSEKFFNIKLRVNTTSEETDTANDFKTLNIKVVIETDIVVRGSSDPAEMFYGGEVRGESAIQYEDQIGNHVVHNYEVVNYGKGKVPNATLWISWPYEVENGYPHGKHLLYLMSEPEVKPPVVCYTPPGRVNPLGIEKRPATKGGRKIETRLGGQNQPTGTYTHTEATRRRVRRENVIQPEYVIDQGRNVRVVKLDCEKKSAKCFKIRCELGVMEEAQSIAIRLRARLWNSTFLEDYRNVDHVQIFSMAELDIDPVLNVQQPTDNDKAKAMLKAIPDISSVEQPGVQIWVYILAGCAGLIVLIIIVLLLWKCGFFKRRTPKDMRKTRQYKKMKYKSPGNDEDYYS